MAEVTYPPRRAVRPLLGLGGIGFAVGLTAGAAIRSWTALAVVLALLGLGATLLWAPPRRHRRRLDRMHAAVLSRDPLGSR